MNFNLRLAVIVSWLFAVPYISWAAQSGSGNGALEGVVLDADAKPVPGVSVEIRELQIGYVRSTMTDSL